MDDCKFKKLELNLQQNQITLVELISMEKVYNAKRIHKIKLNRKQNEGKNYDDNCPICKGGNRGSSLLLVLIFLSFKIELLELCQSSTRKK
jgi:hypothetical protein